MFPKETITFPVVLPCEEEEAANAVKVNPARDSFDGENVKVLERAEQWFLDDIVEVCRRLEVDGAKHRAS